MDNGFATEEDGPQPALSYDDTVPYEDQLHTTDAPSLANRIGSTKVYLLSDASSSTAVRLGKKKQHDDVEQQDEMDTDQDPSLRPNAILLQGPPIAHLPTARLFEYTAHFDVHPLALEWIDDNTCIFVFPSKLAARSAFLALKKPNATTTSSSSSSSSDATDLTTARAIPVSLWPPEDRIHHSLGVGQGLKGTLLMRWAQNDDRKKRGAKKDSEFYKKHGSDAGKESAGFGVVPASVVAASSGHQGSLARRMGQVGDTLEERIAVGEEKEEEEEEEEDSEKTEMEAVREWDRGKPGIMLEKRISTSKRKRMRNDIDEFLDEDGDDIMPLLAEEEVNAKNSAEAADVVPDSPPSKMRSDYIAKDGRTVIGSANGKKGHELMDRITAPLPRRARAGHHNRSGRDGFRDDEGDENSAYEGDGGRKQRGGRRRGRPSGGFSELPRKKTRQELDDELEAFLNSKT